ncbi:TPA: hypothetical protein P4P68_002767 [Enterococcus faecium]|nr:hypothetical protein [Enterococcus faecium]HDO7724774.1 hypothetical protein [Enterococcus faecium]HDO7741526.1 hypothetical protein [Enterococcus faecium]
MYSNSIDFGNYDYSGNPNIAPVINDGNVFSLNNAWTKVTPHGTFATSEKIADGDMAVGIGMVPWSRYDFSKLTVGKRYTLTIPIRINETYTGDVSRLFIRLRCLDKDNQTIVIITAMVPKDTPVGVFTNISASFNVQSSAGVSHSWYAQVGASGDPTSRGSIDIGYNIKLEEGSNTTPYQPNLLDDPYWLGKTPLGKNIRRTDVGNSLPRTTTEYQCYVGNIEGYYEANQDYVITMKATKPATQTFGLYLLAGSQHAGNLMPVEGLTDTWQLNFRPTKEMIDAGVRNQINIFQVPQSTKGEVKIEWIKLEKGDTRTPNIEQYKYFGEGLKDSNNPNDYSWDITPEYTEKSLNNTVSLTEPQSVEGLKNFEDGLQIAGKEVATVPEDTGWVNLTAINGHSWNKQGQIRRIGKLVMFRGSLKGSTLSTQDFCTIPEGFRPSNPTDNYEYQFLLPPQSSNTLDNGGMAYIRPNGVCGLPSFRGTVNLFLAPIQYYID